MTKIWDALDAAPGRMIYPQMGGMGLALTDHTMFDVYIDAEKQLEISRKIEQAFPTDCTYPVDFGTVFLHALDVPLLRPDFDFPSTLHHPVTSMEVLEGLKVPDPEQDGLLPVYFDAIERIGREISKPEMVAVVGPFTLAAELAGVALLAKSTIKNPAFVRRLLDFTTETVLRFVEAAGKRGAGIIQVSEPTTVILSARSFQELITPRLREINDLIRERGVSALHICGNTTQYLPEMLATGTEILSLDQIMPMEETIRSIPPKVILAGNIDPIEIMFHGTPGEVTAATEQLLRQMRPYRNFMPSFGCDCPIETPLENMHAFIHAVRSDH